MSAGRPEGGGFDWRRALENALELLTREGALGQSYRAPFEVVFEDRRVALRRYPVSGVAEVGRPILLVPPLMVTSEIYDISPDLSAVAALAGAGASVWLADFGAPEAKLGGLLRTLDDHVLGISECVEVIVRMTGEDVHLVGYSQGGMFCYQAAAYRFGRTSSKDRGARAGIASVVAFGAPVDIRRNLPVTVHDSLAERLIGGLRRAIDRPLRALEALPGTLSARGFKLLAPVQELRQLAMVLGRLDDKEALAKILPKRRFLGGEGFIAWPGPALRKFIDEFVVENRMKQGGFVIGGRAVSLADIEAPILCVLGLADDLAQPSAVRAIRDAAARAEVYVVEVDAGHFGLVVGSVAMRSNWPLVLDWVRWLDAGAAEEERPAGLGADREAASRRPGADGGERGGILGDSAERVWEALGGVSVQLVGAWERTRWRLPRTIELMRLRPDSRVSPSRLLRRRARAIGERVCFLWRGRAFSYAEADRRVDELARALHAWGVRAGDEVGVVVGDHPDFYSTVLALNRLRAVAVLGAMGVGRSCGRWVCDVDGLERVGPEAVAGAWTLALVGEGEPRAGVVSLENLAAELEPEDMAGFTALRLDAGLASEAALVVCGEGGGPDRETARAPSDASGDGLSNGGWFRGAIEAAMEYELRPGDTVYAGIPLGTRRALVDVLGAALVGGARLAVAALEGAERRAEAARVGATVVFARGRDGFLTGGAIRRVVTGPDPGRA